MKTEIIKIVSKCFTEELEKTAKVYYDRRVTHEKMMNDMRQDNAFKMEDDMAHMMKTITHLHENGALDTAPVTHWMGIDLSPEKTLAQMQSSQFVDWGEGKPLYVKVLLENPNVGLLPTCSDTEYWIDVDFYEYGIVRSVDIGEVFISKEDQFCMATFTVPYSCIPDSAPAGTLRGRVLLHMRENSIVSKANVTGRNRANQTILASADFTAFRLDDEFKDFTSYIKVREAFVYDREEGLSSLKAVKQGTFSELALRFEFQHQFPLELANILPEIEVEFLLGSGGLICTTTNRIIKAKPYIKNGETVYIADGTFFGQRSCKEMEEATRKFEIRIWDKTILKGSFKVGPETKTEVVTENYINGVLAEGVGSKYEADGIVITEGEPAKQERKPYDYLNLSSLNLYRQDVLDALTDDSPGIDGQTTFKDGFTCDITIYALFDYLKGEFDNAEMEIVTYCLYDNTGRLLQTVTGSQSTNDGGDGVNIFVSFASFSPQGETWEKGTYRIEASMWNEAILSIRFDICDKDNYGMFDPAGSQLRMNRGGRKIVTEVSDARRQLDELIGLKRIKDKIDALKEVNKFGMLRQRAGLSYKRQSLHASFIGASGTGKTTVASLIGQIYKEMGLLSKGHVVYEERSTLIGRYYDSELRETERALRNAEGGILFIDEAYSLYVEEDPRDPGHKVLEALLTALSDEKNRDWMLVLAGYPDQMEKMLNSNQGLKSRVSDVFFFDDMTQDELLEVADLYCRRNDFILTPDARRSLESVIAHDYASKTKSFGNARYVNNLLEKQVVPAMANRLCGLKTLSKRQLMTIEKEDIPAKRKNHASKKMERLNAMVGLENLKQNISKHLNFVQMVNNRMNHGLHTSMPPLHMIFTGNPGTGKSTVADFMGEIYASIGVLSHGEVIKVERRDLVGQHVGETEKKMNEILDRAKGNVLFIDEAYQLWVEDGKNDFGKIAIESLLGVMANDQLDMIVILAGYTKEMEKLMEMNSGLKSRFPYIFHFEDYTTEELIEIAELTIKREKFVLSPDAQKRLSALIKREVNKKQSSFGNARFVNRLISTSILPAMASRLASMEEMPGMTQLTTIIEEDIPISADEATRIELGAFDEEIISAALKRLDEMVGLKYVKETIHNFVDTARYTCAERQNMFSDQVMKWNFLGNTGTGKSTIAQIMADILKGMGLIGNSEVVEIKGEEYYNVPEYRCDEILRKVMEKAKYGLLFVDSDAPMFRNADSWVLTGEQLRIKLATLTAEIGGNGAIIIAECETSRPGFGPSLEKKGVFGIDRTLVFEDYTADELFEILAIQLKNEKAEFSEEAAVRMRAYIEALCGNRSLEMANARTMKLLSQSILQIMLLRESRGDGSAPKGTITAADVDSFEWHKPYQRKIGF